MGGVPSTALGGVLRRPGEGVEWRVLRRRVRAAIAPESRCGALAAYRVWWRVGWYRRITAVSADGRGIDGGRSAAALLERPQHNLTLAGRDAHLAAEGIKLMTRVLQTLGLLILASCGGLVRHPSACQLGGANPAPRMRRASVPDHALVGSSMLVVRVRDHCTGSPMSVASVSVFAAPDVEQHAATDSNGVGAVAIGASTYLLRVRAIGYAVTRDSVIARPGYRDTIDVRLRRDRMRIHSDIF